jgi:predicted ABC-type ATPase
MASPAPVIRPFILVLAGVNGAGKSSVGGAMLEAHGLTWFNPDSYARELAGQLGLDVEQASFRAWRHGRVLLEAALERGRSHAFETTLGGRTISALLERASRTHDVMMIFVGLASPEQHINRVRLRVAHGGHDIPERNIRERWVTSRANLVRLLPLLARLQVFDNSVQMRPGDEIPDPVLVLETNHGRVVFPDVTNPRALAGTPEWAQPMVQAATENFS